MKPFIPISFILSLLFACNPKKQPEFTSYQGYAQGTTFHIEVNGNNDYGSSIDSILKSIDKELSLWDSTSWISKWNAGNYNLPLGPHAYFCLQLSKHYFWQSKGYFDPSLGPLVQYWGFGSSNNSFPDSVDSLILNQTRNLVGFDKVLSFDSSNQVLTPKYAGAKLDFNAIAQGYSVDALAAFLEENGHKNYMVEIGGEVRCKGKSPQNTSWKIGIDKPLSNNESRALQAILNVEGGLATSGSYRKFYEQNGKKFAHVIDPKSGFPVSHQLVSVSVLAKTTAQADAMATALLAMGTKPAIAFSKEHPDLGIFLIYEEAGAWQTYVSDKMKASMAEQHDTESTKMNVE